MSVNAREFTYFSWYVCLAGEAILRDGTGGKREGCARKIVNANQIVSNNLEVGILPLASIARDQYYVVLVFEGDAYLLVFVKRYD